MALPLRAARYCARRGTSIAFLLCVIALAASPCAADSWPGFRGPGARGASNETGVFPNGPFSLHVAWKVVTGSGYSGVAVVGDYVVTSFAAGENDVLSAFDAKTGKELWRTPIGPLYKGHDGSHDGPIATPFIDGDRVFMLSPQGTLAAFALSNGHELWSVDLVKEYESKPPFYGYATSPIVVDGVLIVEAGAPKAAVIGLDPLTGKRLWAVGDDKIDYQTPVLQEGGLILAAGAKNLIAIKPKTGEVLWTFEHTAGDARGSGSLVPVPAGPNRVFLANKDEASMVVSIKRDDATPSFDTLWEGNSIRKSYNVPAYLNNHLYAYSSRFVTSVDAATGERAWRSREPGDGFLILVDGHLVVATKEGAVHIVRATPDGFDERASVKACDDLIWAHPSFADGCIYVRSHGELARVDVARGASTAEAALNTEGTLPATQFGRFIASLTNEKDKPASVGAFLKEQKSFPIVEDKDVVHFVYAGEGKDLALAGDLFGARQERPMQHVEGTGLFYYSMKVPADTRLNYLFMRDYETMLDPRNPRETVTTLVDKEMEMSFSGAETPMSWFAMPDWSMPPYLSAHAETPSGKVETVEMESKAFEKALSFDVYTPPDYPNGDTRYPVLYVHGGAGAIKYGKLPHVLDILAGRRMTPVIAVFIKEGTFGGADKYVAMFGEELIPFIDGKYRTIPERGARGVIGAGFAGTDAMFCAFKHPGLIGKIGTQSAFVFDSFTPDVFSSMPTAAEHPFTMYMDWGKYDFRNPHEAWDMSTKNCSLYDALKEHGYRVTGGEANDGSDWSSWKNRLGALLEALFPRT